MPMSMPALASVVIDDPREKEFEFSVATDTLSVNEVVRLNVTLLEVAASQMQS